MRRCYDFYKKKIRYNILKNNFIKLKIHFNTYKLINKNIYNQYK